MSFPRPPKQPTADETWRAMAAANAARDAILAHAIPLRCHELNRSHYRIVYKVGEAYYVVYANKEIECLRLILQHTPIKPPIVYNDHFT